MTSVLSWLGRNSRRNQRLGNVFRACKPGTVTSCTKRPPHPHCVFPLLSTYVTLSLDTLASDLAVAQLAALASRILGELLLAAKFNFALPNMMPRRRQKDANAFPATSWVNRTDVLRTPRPCSRACGLVAGHRRRGCPPTTCVNASSNVGACASCTFLHHQRAAPRFVPAMSNAN